MSIFNVTQLTSGLKRFGNRLEPAVQKGLGQAGLSLLNDAVMMPPTVPKRTGRLRESGSAIVGTTVAAVSPRSGSASGEQYVAGTPYTGSMPDRVQGRLACFVGYNTEYAAKVHNSPGMQFRESGSGAFYLQKKMREHNKDYIGVANDVIRRELGTG